MKDILTPLAARECARFPGPPGVQACFSADGTWLARLDSPGTITLWDLEEGRPAGVLPTSGPTTSVALSASGAYLARGVGCGGLQVWVAPGRLAYEEIRMPVCRALDFSPDERTVLVGGRGLACLESGGAPVDWRDGDEETWCVRFDRHGSRIAEAYGGVVAVWRASGRVAWKAPTPPLEALDFGVDVLAGVGPDGLHAWEVPTGRPLEGLRTDPVHALCFAPDGATLALAAADRILVLETQGWTHVGAVQAHGALAVHLAPGGRLAATLEAGDTVLWDLVPQDKDWLVRGEAAWDEGNWPEALRCFDWACHERPKDAACHLWRGLTLYEMDRFREARGALEECVGLDPQSVTGWLNLGIVHAVEGDLQAAERCRGRLEGLDPGAAARLEAMLQDSGSDGNA